MTQIEIAVQMAAELAAGSAVDAFGEDIPNAQTAWDFINEQVYEEEGRPLHLPDTMPHSFGPLYLVEAAKLLRAFIQNEIDRREESGLNPKEPYIKSATDALRTVKATQRLIRAVVAGMDYNPGHSDLDDEQPITVRMTLGDYRLACRMREPLPSEFRVTFLAEDGLRYTLGNQGVLSLADAAEIVRANNQEDSTAECRVEQLIGSDWKEVLCDQIAW